MTIEQIAKVAHELNKAYCQSVGDHTQQEWDAAPEWQRQSSIKGVIFHILNPDASPSDSHDSWLNKKEEEGWSYGPVKNPEAKEHPCFVPYEELPTEQRSKYYIFRQTVHSLQVYLS